VWSYTWNWKWWYHVFWSWNWIKMYFHLSNWISSWIIWFYNCWSGTEMPTIGTSPDSAQSLDFFLFWLILVWGSGRNSDFIFQTKIWKNWNWKFEKLKVQKIENSKNRKFFQVTAWPEYDDTSNENSHEFRLNEIHFEWFEKIKDQRNLAATMTQFPISITLN